MAPITSDCALFRALIKDVFLDFFNNSSYYIQFYSQYALVVIWLLMWILPMVIKIMWSQVSHAAHSSNPCGESLLQL